MTRKFDHTWTRVDDPTPTPPPAGGAGASPDSPPAAAKQAQGGGLACPECGCRHFEVIETTSRHPGTIRRRRACRNCGHRVTTRERTK